MLHNLVQLPLLGLLQQGENNIGTRKPFAPLRHLDLCGLVLGSGMGWFGARTHGMGEAR